jgi:hypothetical protein
VSDIVKGIFCGLAACLMLTALFIGFMWASYWLECHYHADRCTIEGRP